MPSAGAARARGFTLVELLVGLTVVALISVLLFSGLRLGQRTWEVTDARATRAGDMRTARRFLEQALLQARPVLHRFETGSATLFWGDQTRLEWVSPLSAHTGFGGLALWRLEMDASADPPRLVLHRWLYHPAALGGAVAPWTPLGASPPVAAASGAGGGLYSAHVLLEEISGFDIGYLDRKDGAAAGWRPTWLEGRGIPAGVRLRILTPGQQWPDLVVDLPDDGRGGGAAVPVAEARR